MDNALKSGFDLLAYSWNFEQYTAYKNSLAIIGVKDDPESWATAKYLQNYAALEITEWVSKAKYAWHGFQS